MNAAAGPLLIAASVLVVLNRFAFRGWISNQYADLPGFFWPTGCFLGRSLASGHIPAWNPHVMGGVPFAADPQSGWMAVVPMALFTALPCAVAIRWLLVAQPLLAGLGVFAFCRSEGLSRIAATTGGLVLALSIAGSGLLLNPPFGGTLAWTALLLASSSRLLRADRWPSRLAWLTVTALAWGQLAATHLTGGLAVGTLALAVFVVARLVSADRSAGPSRKQMLIAVALLLVAFPALNLAFFLPRLTYLPRTSLGQGYLRLDQLSRHLGAGPSGAFARGVPVSFVLRLHRSPGLYVGTIAAALAFAGLWSKGRRLAGAFAVYGAVCLILAMDPVARAFPAALRSGVVESAYLREPLRLALGAVLALALLAALGVDAWRAAASGRARMAMVAPGLVLWGVVPFLTGHGDLGAVGVLGGLVVLAVLALTAWRPAAAVLIPIVAAVELAGSCFVGQSAARPNDVEAALSSSRSVVFGAVARPMVPAETYVREGPIARFLSAHPGLRYVSIAPTQWSPRGYQVRDQGADWGLMGSQRSMIFGIEEGQGYNPAQLLRYWTFVRAVDPKPIYFNAAGFIRAPPVALDLLDVGYAVRNSAPVPELDGGPVAEEGPWSLVRTSDPTPRATVVTAWTIARSPDAALRSVLAPGFDPNREAVVESFPSFEPSAVVGGSATYRQQGPQAARVTVDASTPSLVLIRNAFDPGWHARVDGRSVPVLRADYLDQAVAVPAGRHVIDLTYVDRSIGLGLLGSGLALASLVFVTAFIVIRDRPRRRRAHGGGYQ